MNQEEIEAKEVSVKLGNTRASKTRFVFVSLLIG